MSIRTLLLGVGGGFAAVLTAFGLLAAHSALLQFYAPNLMVLRWVVATGAVLAVAGIVLVSISALLYRFRAATSNIYVALMLVFSLVGIAAYPWLVSASAVNDCLLSVDFPLRSIHACER